MKSIRALGLVTLTALALTAFSGVAAAAPSGLSIVNYPEGPEFHSEIYPAAINGTQLEKAGRLKYYTDAGTMVCAKTTFRTPTFWAPNGKIVGDTAELWQAATHEECTIAGIEANVTSALGCGYTFAVSGGAGPFVGWLFICKTEIDFKASDCLVTIEPQSKSGMEYVNVGSGSSATVEAKANLSGLKYVVAGAESCPNGVKNGSYSNGKLIGAVSMSAAT